MTAGLVLQEQVPDMYFKHACAHELCEEDRNAVTEKRGPVAQQIAQSGAHVWVVQTR